MVNKNVFTRCVQGPLFLFYERLPDHHVLYFMVISAKHLQCSHQSQKSFVAKYQSLFPGRNKAILEILS